MIFKHISISRIIISFRSYPELKENGYLKSLSEGFPPPPPPQDSLHLQKNQDLQKDLSRASPQPHPQLSHPWLLNGVRFSFLWFICLFILTWLSFSLDSLKSPRWNNKAHKLHLTSWLAKTTPTKKAVKIPWRAWPSALTFHEAADKQGRVPFLSLRLISAGIWEPRDSAELWEVKWRLNSYMAGSWVSAPAVMLVTPL